MKETINYTELVKQAVNGDNAAFEELYRVSVKSAFRTASLMLSNTNDAEDVVQNAYIKAAEKLSELKNPESFENWLKAIVENECKNYIRKEKRITAPFILLKRKEEVSKEPVEAVPQEIVEREDLQKDVTEIIKSLSPETRACIVLFHFEDKSLNEIAEILNIPVGTVKSRLHNGRKKIEKQFDKLRKKDPTLYGIGAIPVLLSFIAYQSQNVTVPAAISTAAAVTAGTTASTAAGSTATAAATAGTTLSAGTAAATTATAVAAKVAAIAVAGTLAVGGTAAIKSRIEKNTEQTTEYLIEAEEEGTAATTRSYSTESLSEETNTERNTVQSTVSVHTDSQIIMSTSSFQSDLTEIMVQQTTAVTTQKPTETTTKPTTQAESTTVMQPTTQSTTQLATEATQPPATNRENNYSTTSGVITEYNGSDTRVSIPSSIDGNTVTSIGAGAFQGNTNIASVSLPDTVTQIGQEAFADCSSLSSVSLPASLKQIGIGAFYGCSSLISVNIPNSVTKISDEAFANCTSLKTATIPASATNIADDAFSGCDSLTIICSEGSAAHNFAVDNSISYTFVNSN